MDVSRQDEDYCCIEKIKLLERIIKSEYQKVL